jgi:hypothetical protein
MSAPLRLGRAWAPLALVAAAALTSLPAAATGNTSAPENWRLDPTATFNGVANAFNGTALLLVTTTEATSSFACSGSLMHGGQYVLTAAHCVSGWIDMSVNFGWYNGKALETRTVVSAVTHPGWDGTLETGADLALVKLNSQVTGLNSYSLSTTYDVGKQHVITGYGSSGVGSSRSEPNWDDGDYGHYGYNTFDTTSLQFETAWDNTFDTDLAPTVLHGTLYVSDFDAPSSLANAWRYNTLQRIADLTGGTWTNNAGLGANEALIAGGDSGGGDFIFEDGEWKLSAVHSWGWQFCQGNITPSCDYRTRNGSSYGDLSGSTAVFDQLAWINSVIAVPEPGSGALMGLGLAFVAGAVRRRG